jgi:nitroimidazol reductase NimA-like FMN-containing flavoprotein (pyridoxamine 5'-phosphate oxidase superfamily)
MREPQAELDSRYSSEDATAPAWSHADALLSAAELFWISTVRPGGRPHVTPLPAVWVGGALHFCTGPEERKARNLALNPHVVLTTGTNT